MRNPSEWSSRLQRLQNEACSKYMDLMEDSHPFGESYLAQLIDPELRAALELEMKPNDMGELCQFDVGEWRVHINLAPMPGMYMVCWHEVPMQYNERGMAFVRSTQWLKPSSVQPTILALVRRLTQPDVVANQLDQLFKQ